MQGAIPDVERLVIDKQADYLAIGDIDDGLTGLREAVACLRVRQWSNLIKGVQIAARQRVRVPFVEVAAQADVPVGQGEDGFALREQVQVQPVLNEPPGLGPVGRLLDHRAPSSGSWPSKFAVSSSTPFRELRSGQGLPPHLCRTPSEQVFLRALLAPRDPVRFEDEGPAGREHVAADVDHLDPWLGTRSVPHTSQPLPASSTRMRCPSGPGTRAARMRAVVSAAGWLLRVVCWPGARYSVGAVEVPAGFPAGERAAGLTGRRAECGVLDRLVEAVQAGESRVLVAVGEPGVGKTVLLEYVAGRASGCQVARASGVQSEMELAFAGLHQLCAPMLSRAERARRELIATGGTVRKPSVETSVQLTAQETLIARLAGDGHSNAEIATQLFLSARTV